MSDQMPMFEDPAPPVEPKPPKKPRQKPVRKARKLAAPKPVPKKRRKKRAANKPKADFVIPYTRKSLREMSPIEFLEVVAGITMAPWQRRVIAAYLEKDK